MTRTRSGTDFSPKGHIAGKRLGSLAYGVLYGFICASTVTFLLGASQTSGDNQSKDVTARLMGHSWGRLLVLVIGLVVVGAGVMLAAFSPSYAVLVEPGSSSAWRSARRWSYRFTSARSPCSSRPSTRGRR